MINVVQCLRCGDNGTLDSGREQVCAKYIAGGNMVIEGLYIL